MQDPTLVLRDIHAPAAPPWWPPAPGWWLVALALLIVALGLATWRHRRQVRRRRIAALFDEAVAAAPDPAARVAAMSELLRRAARRHHPHAEALAGEQWLALLDGDRDAGFSRGAGRLLLEGGFRREVDAQAVAALHALARARFLGWMLK